MKVAWWMYANTDQSVFTMANALSRQVPLIFAELQKRGHEISLVHTPRPPSGEWKSVRRWRDPGPYNSLWDPRGQEIHETILKMSQAAYREGEHDAQTRAAKKLFEWMQSSEWKNQYALEADVQYIKMLPCVSIIARMEMMHAIMRGVLCDVPTVMLDGEYAGQMVVGTCDDLFNMAARNPQPFFSGWNRKRFLELFTLWTPYETKIWPGNQYQAWPAYYDAGREWPDDPDTEVEYTFGYVGNDYQREEKLMEFYKKQHDDNMEVENAVWGRWRLEKYPAELADIIGRETFKGPVGARDVSPCYRKCAASIVITHRRFYPCKLVTPRWFEIMESGRLVFVDMGLKSDQRLWVPEDQYVQTTEEARRKLEHWTEGSGEAYWRRVQKQREVSRRYELSPQWVVDALEATAKTHGIEFNWTHAIESRGYQSWGFKT